MNTDYDTRARKIHEWWNKSTGQNARLTMVILRGWMDLLIAGHNGQEVRRVLVYLLKEIRNNRRQRGSLALQNFLLIENFEKDLALANMESNDVLNPDRRIPASPESQPLSSHSSHKSHPSTESTPPTPKQPFATSQDFRKLLEQLS